VSASESGMLCVLWGSLVVVARCKPVCGPLAGSVDRSAARNAGGGRCWR
jgi:hypothetical protein